MNDTPGKQICAQASELRKMIERSMMASSIAIQIHGRD